MVATKGALSHAAGRVPILRATSASEEEAVAKVSKDAAEAVASVFLVLCGKADRQDYFTGLQEEMNLQMQKVVKDALTAGQELVNKGLNDEQARFDRQITRELEVLKKEANERVLSQAAQMKLAFDNMCEQLEQQSVDMKANLSALQEAQARLQADLDAAREQLKHKQDHCLVLFEEISEHKRALETRDAIVSDSAELIAKLEAELAAARRPDPKLAELEAANRQLQDRWNEDVKLMQLQIQKEVEARVAAEEREHALRQQVGAMEDGLDDKDSAGQRRVAKLQDKVAKLERARADDERRHTQHIQQMSEKHGEALAAERAAKAFAEEVSSRLEHELLVQARAWTHKTNLKFRFGRANAEFQDFSADLARLVGAADRPLSVAPAPAPATDLPPMKPRPPSHPSTAGSGPGTSTGTGVGRGPDGGGHDGSGGEGTREENNQGGQRTATRGGGHCDADKTGKNVHPTSAQAATPARGAGGHLKAVPPMPPRSQSFNLKLQTEVDPGLRRSGSFSGRRLGGGGEVQVSGGSQAQAGMPRLNLAAAQRGWSGSFGKGGGGLTGRASAQDPSLQVGLGGELGPGVLSARGSLSGRGAVTYR